MAFLDRYSKFLNSSELSRSKVEKMRVDAIKKSSKTKKGRKGKEPFMVSHLVSDVRTKTTFREWQDVLNHVRELKSQNIPYRVYAYANGIYSELREHSDLHKL